MARKRSPLSARQYKVAQAFTEDLSQAWQRMRAMSEVERLRWVVAFAQQPLARVAPPALSRLGNELRGLASTSGGISYTIDVAPMQQAMIEEIQSRIKVALEALVRDGREVPMPLVPAVISRMLFQVQRVPANRRARFQVRHDAQSETDAILASVFELIRGEAGHQLHPCPRCGTPVVVNRRQLYCGPRCSQRVRDWLRSHPGQPWKPPQN